MVSVTSSKDQIFDSLPEKREDCVDERQADLHHERAKLRLQERYSHLPWYAERAKKDPHYWDSLAGSAVNI